MPIFVTPPALVHSFDQSRPFATELPGCTLAITHFDREASLAQGFAASLPDAAGSNPKRQIEHVAGRVCAAQALSDAGYGFHAPPRDPSTGQPLWPAGWCGSITHSHGIAAAVTGQTTRWHGLGLDLEKTLVPDRAQRLRRAILTADEQHWMDGHCPEAAALNLTLVFSAKESLFKTLNPLTGTYFGFQDARVIPGNQAGQLQLQLLRDLSGPYLAGTLFSGVWATYGHGVLTLVHLAANENVTSPAHAGQ